MAAHQEGEALIVPTSGLGGVDQIGTAPPTTAVLYRQHLKVRISDNLTWSRGWTQNASNVFIHPSSIVRTFLCNYRVHRKLYRKHSTNNENWQFHAFDYFLGSHPNTPGTPASAVGFRGRGGGGGGRGGGGGGRGMDRSQSWFHSSMLEDPWASLVNSQPSSFQCDNVQSLDNKQPLSDSMLPQVGDSILERLDTYSAESGNPAADTDKNSAGDEDEWMHATIMKPIYHKITHFSERGQ